MTRDEYSLALWQHCQNTLCWPGGLRVPWVSRLDFWWQRPRQPQHWALNSQGQEAILVCKFQPCKWWHWKQGEITQTAKIINQMSALQTPWWCIARQGSVMEFGLAGEQPVSWFILCGGNLKSFLDNWSRCDESNHS